MGSQNLSSDEAMRAEMRVHLSLIPLATLVSPLLCQLKFNGGVSSSSSSNSNSPSANRNTNSNRPTDVDEKFFFGGDTPSLTGNQALDGGIVGLGLGALGAAVLGPTIQGAFNGGQQSQGYSCGRRKRQANFGGSQTSGGGGQEIDGEERFFLPTGQGCTCNTNGRRRRLAPGSLAGSLVGNNRIVAAAATTASPSTTMDSTVTSRTKASTTKTRVLTTKTRDSTTKASTAKTRGSTTRTTGDASATTA